MPPRLNGRGDRGKCLADVLPAAKLESRMCRFRMLGMAS